MKNLFFYANFRTWDYTLGITRKVYLQIEAFKKLGYCVTYCGYLKDGVAIFDNNGNIILSKNYPIANPSVQHVIRRGMLMRLVIKYLKSCDGTYDIGYARYHFFDNVYIKLLKEIKSRSKQCIIEAHSTPKFTNKLSFMYLIGKRDALWSKLAHKYVDFIASMSDESQLWGIKTIKISNAVDLDSIKIHNYKGAIEDINFISVSYERDVHGYDRLIKGIYEYYKYGGTRKIRFHMVGSTMASTEELIRKLHLQDICLVYGPKCGSELDEIYDKANIGVGCLANHRIGSFFGSALKTKEYIAKGIPFIYGWKEQILESFKYGLEFELCEEPINVDEVIRFYDNLEKKDLAIKIRACLGKEDTWQAQMKKVTGYAEANNQNR